MTTVIGMSLGVLADALTEAMEDNGAWGKNLHPSKDVMLRAGEYTVPLTSVVFQSGGGLRLDGTIAAPCMVLSVGYLREAIIRGSREEKVLVNVAGLVLPLAQVACSFQSGSFCLILDGKLEGE